MGPRIVLAVLLGLLPMAVDAADSRPDYSGHYELADPISKRVLNLSLTQKGSRVHAVFFAADYNAPGAQPTGEGDGRINDDGVLEIKFKDNLKNKGTATLERDHRLYRFEIRVTNIVDPSPLHFYGVAKLKRVEDPAPASVPSI